MKYQNIREEEIKNKVGQDFFSHFDATKIVGNIDFCVSVKPKDSKQEQLFETHSLLWAEAKKGDFDVYAMFAQLILTIGKERTFDKFLPPAFLGAFDGKKIAFIPYNTFQDIFFLNDFNWNVTPSNHDAKEFKLIKERITQSLDENNYLFDFVKDESELKFFIKNNIAKATEGGKIHIDKNNFVNIYLRWLDQVKPTINFDWAEGKKQNILDNDFYLADLFVDDKGTAEITDDTPLSDNLFVVFRNSHYEIAKENLKSLFNASIEIKDKKAYEQFWKKYKRPPLAEFQQYIIDRRDLLVPQDIRERKGAFFTPKKWVDLSQKYIADVLGEDWQDEYYIWDCAAGTGNLLVGLTNKYNIWASTLDQADVNVMHERIDNGANLLKDHCFQFDFLNDEFTQLPQGLQDIINNEEKRKKLVVYINPPYAEASTTKTRTGTGENKLGVSESMVYNKYQKLVGTAARELFTQFLTRIYMEIPNCKIVNFSKLKNLQSSNFSDFREMFRAKLEKIFLVPSYTFDNVKGKFPISLQIWNTSIKEKFNGAISDVFGENEDLILHKNINPIDGKLIINWLRNFYDKKNEVISFLRMVGTDMQNYQGVFITNGLSENDFRKKLFTNITKNNVIEMCIYHTVRHCIDATWLNDRDQFYYPNNGWQSDVEFQSDCLTFTLFSNNIQSKFGTNHWIPFTEQEVNARDKFESNFMTQFIKGKIKPEAPAQDLFSTQATVSSSAVENQKPLQFSEKATHVFDAGRELWKYYHAQPNVNVNASLYDIREYFQGRNDNGKMNNKSQDEHYNLLIGNLRKNLKILAKKIEPKVYEYGFLKE